MQSLEVNRNLLTSWLSRTLEPNSHGIHPWLDRLESGVHDADEMQRSQNVALLGIVDIQPVLAPHADLGGDLLNLRQRLPASLAGWTATSQSGDPPRFTVFQLMTILEENHHNFLIVEHDPLLYEDAGEMVEYLAQALNQGISGSTTRPLA